MGEISLSTIALEAGIKQWQSLPRNNAAELQVADDFYDNELMPLALQLFLDRQKEKITKTYFGMILTLGTSWQPLALSIALLKPKKILIMCTQETFPLLMRLKSFLKLNDDSVKVVFISRSDSCDVYYAVNEFYSEHSSQGNICADITGGTKAMASSAAMIAAFLGLDIYYIESRYLPLYRRPMPGSEELKTLANPRGIL